MSNIYSYHVGVNIGSVSVNLVYVDAKGNFTKFKRPHLGKPIDVLNQIIEENLSSKKCYFGVSGSFGDLSEIVAVERGISSLNEKFDVVISLGGEGFVLYVLNENGHIINVLSHDKCAAGSGEFFVQQIGRLDISLNEAISLAQKGKKIELASRCSVHCKSDITHKLNKGEASIEDILTSVLSSMVNKVMGLIFQSRVDVKSLLLIGGVSLNEAFVKLLRERLNDAEVVVKDVSSVFEAYGTALIVKDSPIHQQIEIKTSQSFSTFPSLHQFSNQVTIIESTEYKKDFNQDSEFLLGVDVGSTTTKAVLVDPADTAVIASYYGKTSGNPIEATKKCIKEIISQVGDCKVNLVGVTGSGRQIVGAYLGTSAVYNEISAHSEGAVYYDPDVDTIFEIGGQDSKYMFLQNGVPVDYAMNASCSAGTGSFLEESSKGDLGIDISDLSQIAMEANDPIRFKADCAAFINTDVRTALQEGYCHKNIVGGLVYSIAENYLNKVKGTRSVGKKIFFQGGVAKNNSVGYAFAQTTGKQIIIPPNPELIGAFGIALIAKAKNAQSEIKEMPKRTCLESLAKEELKHLGSFTCKSCKNYCEIERYEVGGRKFPFGGRCSKYEHLWKGSEKLKEKENLVDQRNELIFERKDKRKKRLKQIKGKIGIPRALLTHSLFPLFSTFFEEIGYEVILSDIDEDKENLTNASFCYPVQILHGAVYDLIKKEIPIIFLPHVHKLTKGEKWFDSTFCPITQASPYIISRAFNDTRFLNPVLDYSKGYESDESLVKMAVKELKQPKYLVEEAYEKAVVAQKEVEDKFLQLGKEVLQKLKGSKEIAILLVGRSYNVFPPETSQLIPKKLASMGVTVIPFDFLDKYEVDDIPWYFANYAKVAIDLAKNNDNLFLLYINSFSCTIDAFIQNYVKSEMSSKPFLLLELDSHTADAGTQTRLEAFLEIIDNFQKITEKTKTKPFQISRVEKTNGKIEVITSNGMRLDIRDSRVKLFMPGFSKYHTAAFTKGFELYGFNVGTATDIKLEYPIKGLRHCSGKECLPLPIVLGNILTIVENRKNPEEVIGIYMMAGGSPCAVFSYIHYLEQFIEDNRIENLFIFRFDQLTNFLGVGLLKIARYNPKIVLLADIMGEIESSLHVVGEKESINLLHTYWSEFLDTTKVLKDYDKNVEKLIERIATIPRKGSPETHPKVLISGDFFVRFSPFFLRELREIYTKHGIIVKSSDMFELTLYSSFHLAHVAAHSWKRDPYKFTTALKALSTFWTRNAQLFFISKIGPVIMYIAERKQRKKYKKTGLLLEDRNSLKLIIKHSKPLISLLIFGEAIPTIGKGMEILEESNYDSLILTGPINCLPYKISQSILKPIYMENNTPFLVFDSDISAITPNMKRLIHANIEQIKRRRTKRKT